jgi:DegV family protein with EDD domain
MTIKIITDGCVDLPDGLADELNISIVPLSVNFGSDSYSSDLDREYFYSRMKAEAELPKTSSPSPNDFLIRFKEAIAEKKDVLVLSCTSKISSTYHHAVMAKEMLEEEGICSQKVEVLDSKSASVGLGLLAVYAANWSKSGFHFNELLAKVKHQIEETRTYFALDTLENVIKGGRLDKLKGKVASVLNIKLVMWANEEGAIEVVEKIRGTQKALKRLIDKVGETWHQSEKKIIAVAHSNCEDRAKEFIKELISKYPFEQVIMTNIGPVIGTYAGEGGIVIAY